MKTPEIPSLFIRDKDLIRIKNILKSYVPNYVILLYGSRVNGTAHSASDLDLVIKSNDGEPLDISTLVDLKEAFQNSNIPILVILEIGQEFHITLKRKLKKCTTKLFYNYNFVIELVSFIQKVILCKSVIHKKDFINITLNLYKRKFHTIQKENIFTK